MIATEVSNVKVSAYLTPHPLDEDSEMEYEWLSWIPGYDSTEIGEDGTYPLYRDENIALYEKIELITEKHFRKGLENIWPLLNDHVLVRMSIAIDILGLLSSKTSLAGYNFEYSKPEKGKYTFHLDSNLLAKYVQELNGNDVLDLKDSFTWEHEIIHLLDHWEIIRSSIYQLSDSLQENFKYSILKYREEGIAELYYFLKGGSGDITSLKEAKKLFVQKIEENLQLIESKDLTNGQLREKLYSGYSFYALGPWLILDMLKSFEGGWNENKIHSIFDKIENKYIISEEEIIDIIQVALRIKCDEFIEYVKSNYLTNLNANRI
jgi:hypothetical protein